MENQIDNWNKAIKKVWNFITILEEIKHNKKIK